MGTNLPEPDFYSNQYSSSGVYDRLDRFDRPITDIWRADRATDRDIYKTTIAYDRNSNITSIDDELHKDVTTGNGVWDASFGMDNLNRLISAREGHWDGTQITTGNRKFEQLREGRTIGSGQVEGACKTIVGRRLKLNSARWRVGMADRMAALGCLLYSNLWNRFWTPAAA